MKTCPNCHNETEDLALFCPVCGTTLDAFGQVPNQEARTNPVQQMPVMEIHTPQASKSDHTSDYSEYDIRENRIVCMCVYLLDVIGIIIALLMAPNSDYVRFHIKQSLKFTIMEALLAIFSALLCWTILVPILGVLAMVVLMIAKFGCFLDVARNKAADSPILKLFRFLN